MRKKSLQVVICMFLVCAGGSATADVERVINVTVSNTAGWLAGIDQYLASGESDANSVTALRQIHDGTDPGTHTIVAIFDDVETIDRTMKSQATSAAWAAARRSAAAVSTANSNSLAIQRRTWGNDSWDEGDYLAAVLVNAANGRQWLAAMDDWNRASDVKNPGMVRIVRLRGAPANHAVLIAAPTYSGLINYMEGVEASDAFAKLSEGSDAQVVGTTIYNVMKVWNP